MKLTPIIVWVLCGVLFFLFIRIWVGSGSYPEIWQLQEQIKTQEGENQQLTERNRKLEADVTSITQDDATIEDFARGELGMIKSGEMFYQVILKDQTAPTLTDTPTPAPGVHVE